MSLPLLIATRRFTLPSKSTAMRFLCLLLPFTIFIGCKTTQPSADTSAAVMTAPTGLSGPVYDPSNSPVSASQMPAPPIPASRMPAPVQPGVYDANSPAQNSAAPTAYGSVPQKTAMAPKGEAALANAEAYAAPLAYSAANAPTSYDVAVAAPLPGTPEATLAQAMAGKWVNGTDEREMVEFTPDHYTTYYNGEMLFQEPMTYYATCPGNCNGGVQMEISCFTISGPADTDCYGIVRMTPAVLELSILGLSTETVTYYKQ
jgi:hypothetical protein